MELVERQELLTELRGYLDEAGSASGRLVLIGGEAGIGKTALLRAFVEDLPGSVRVLWGSCDPLSTPRPLAPFHDMEPVATLLERELGRHELLTSLLGELGVTTAMVIDDAHWADEATLDALRFIGRRVDGTRGIVLVTYRDDEVAPDHPLRAVLGDLATAPGARRLSVPRLTPAGVATLALGHPVEPERLHRITGGNPFYVTEVLAAPGWTVPATVADAVLARVARLSPQARDLLEIVSLAPGGLEPAITETLLRDAARALDECSERGVLMLSGGSATFRHEIARLAVQEAVPVGTRRHVHRRLLDALESLPGVDPARLAHHADAAGDDERVLRYAPEAARQAAARGAHREAAAFYGQAVSYATHLPLGDLADLLSSWAGERDNFDDASEMVTLHERCVDLCRQAGDRRTEGAALTRLAESLWAAGRGGDAAQIADEAVEILTTFAPSAELADAYATRSRLAMLARHGDDALRWGSLAVELARRVGAVLPLSRALCSVGATEIVSFERLDGIEKLELGHRIALEAGDDRRALSAITILGSALGEVRRYEEAVPYLERGIEFGLARDLDDNVAYNQAWLARIRFEQGRWEESDQPADAALKRREASPIIRIVALARRGRLMTRRGLPGADDVLEEAWEHALETGDLQRLWPVAAGRAEAAWLADGRAKIATLVGETFELAQELRLRWAVGELGFWLWRAGVLDAAPPDAAEPYALHMHGDWRSAASAWEQLGCPYEQAEALADGNEPAMRQALEIFARLGAEPAADRLRQRMRRAGVARVPARPRASTRAAPAQLTRRQLEVLALLEDGSSNAEIAGRLFITEKTAAHHVSAILRKLGVRSRHEAAAAARKMGIAPAETR